MGKSQFKRLFFGKVKGVKDTRIKGIEQDNPYKLSQPKKIVLKRKGNKGKNAYYYN